MERPDNAVRFHNFRFGGVVVVMNKIVLLSCIGLSVLILVASYSLREGSEAMPENQSAVAPERVVTSPPRRGTVVSPKRTPAPTSEQNPVETMEESAGDVRDFIAAVQRAAPFAEHRAKVKERVEELKKESLEESFVRLQDDQSYIPEGLLSGTMNPKMDLQRMFSNRGFLKVFQEFKALPREEALDNLNEFWEKAIGEYEAGTERTLLFYDVAADPAMREQYEQLRLEMRSSPLRSSFSVKSTFYTPMILAAHLGENTLLADMIDEAQYLTDTRIDRLSKSNAIPLWIKNTILPEDPDQMHPPIWLEENALLSILVYAAERTGVDLSETSIPFDDIEQATIPLVQWDAEWTPYDYPVFRGGVQLDPNDADEQFTVYSFPRHDGRFHAQERKAVVNAVKDVLSR